MPAYSHGRAFGGLKLLLRWLSLFGIWTAALGTIVTMIIWEDGGFLLLTGVVCVSKMGSLWLVCCCIVLWLERYGHLFFYLFGVQWVMPKKVVDLLVCWNWRDTRNCIGVIWNAIPLCITWIIWKERNNRTFEDLEHLLASVKLSLLCTLYAWMATLSGHSFSSILDFLDYWTFIWLPLTVYVLFTIWCFFLIQVY